MASTITKIRTTVEGLDDSGNVVNVEQIEFPQGTTTIESVEVEHNGIAVVATHVGGRPKGR